MLASKCNDTLKRYPICINFKNIKYMNIVIKIKLTCQVTTILPNAPKFLTTIKSTVVKDPVSSTVTDTCMSNETFHCVNYCTYIPG